MNKGIDISYCQPNVDWNKLDVDFVIARAGYGRYVSQKDKMWDSHYKNAKAKGIPIGAYWYSYAMTEAEARLEAKACITILKGTKLEYPVYYDMEESKQYALGRDKVSAIMKAFCTEMEKAGYWVGFYCNSNWYKNVINDECKKRFVCWIAHWNASKPSISGDYGLWQYKVGTQPGVAGDCDLDYGYVDYPSKIKAAGKNGWTKQTNKPAVTKPVKPAKKTVKATIEVNGVTYTGTLTEK